MNSKRYSSLQEFAFDFGAKVSKERNSQKLDQQREKFLSHYRCKVCGGQMILTGGNIMSCQNPKCKGIKEDGGDDVSYIPSYEILDDKWAEYAHKIFD